MKRTHYCGQLTKEQIGEQVTLQGWVQRRRDLGEIIFIDLRDRTGIVQMVFNPDFSKEALEIADSLRNEYVVEMTGTVIERADAQKNNKIKTGDIEVQVTEVEIINKAKNPPFMIEDETDVSEELRLKYRYLDLRRPPLMNNFRMRSEITRSVRNFLADEEFFEVETPILTKSTPEGARDYLVPSRVHDGEFYALPQSPQLFKQLLMVSGFDRYYQIARCFRDEDLRADRQPEFTQIDMEMSFMSLDDILELNERMMKRIMKDVKGIDIETPFQRMPYDEAMARFGSDKPDTRFAMELVDMADAIADSSFKVFTSMAEKGNHVKCINVKGGAEDYTRKDIDGLTDYVARYGAKGLAWIKVTEEGFTGPIAKFFDEEDQAKMTAAADVEAGDLLLFVADTPKVVADALGALRVKLGKERNLIDESAFNFLWVVDWPLFEFDEEAGRYVAAHHPFTRPQDVDVLVNDPDNARAEAYDLVLNGYELGGGSLRIYERDLQEKMFEALGFSKEAAQEQFGFLLDAFEYGTPPHGGIAFGLDRIVMILSGSTNLRDTIAFPKTASASCLLTEAPSMVSEAQLRELNLQLKAKPQ
ncbi:aspartate--tRNA ligase [Savagea sp. SN6]|uniref:Aspartate--tRNA ligase n=1 Tax=Savagea serpentis TaxID=2785297 RepID=A0A8J7GI17_9BACL|nr:aspartate--tRNA ligase [Savagea serpentis]MBF4500120.1 aspartate--tRNA ligase [Savagea serpentis]